MVSQALLVLPWVHYAIRGGPYDADLSASRATRGVPTHRSQLTIGVKALRAINDLNVPSR